MMIHEILILIIATLGCCLIPVGCIIYGTLCALVAVAGYINIILY